MSSFTTSLELSGHCYDMDGTKARLKTWKVPEEKPLYREVRQDTIIIRILWEACPGQPAQPTQPPK